LEHGKERIEASAAPWLDPTQAAPVQPLIRGTVLKDFPNELAEVSGQSVN